MVFLGQPSRSILLLCHCCPFLLFSVDAVVLPVVLRAMCYDLGSTRSS